MNSSHCLCTAEYQSVERHDLIQYFAHEQFNYYDPIIAYREKQLQELRDHIVNVTKQIQVLQELADSIIKTNATHTDYTRKILTHIQINKLRREKQIYEDLIPHMKQQVEKYKILNQLDPEINKLKADLRRTQYGSRKIDNKTEVIAQLNETIQNLRSQRAPIIEFLNSSNAEYGNMLTSLEILRRKVPTYEAYEDEKFNIERELELLDLEASRTKMFDKQYEEKKRVLQKCLYIAKEKMEAAQYLKERNMEKYKSTLLKPKRETNVSFESYFYYVLECGETLEELGAQLKNLFNVSSMEYEDNDEPTQDVSNEYIETQDGMEENTTTFTQPNQCENNQAKDAFSNITVNEHLEKIMKNRQLTTCFGTTEQLCIFATNNELSKLTKNEQVEDVRAKILFNNLSNTERIKEFISNHRLTTHIEITEHINTNTTNTELESQYVHPEMSNNAHTIISERNQTIDYALLEEKNIRANLTSEHTTKNCSKEARSAKMKFQDYNVELGKTYLKELKALEEHIDKVYNKINNTHRIFTTLSNKIAYLGKNSDYLDSENHKTLIKIYGIPANFRLTVGASLSELKIFERIGNVLNKKVKVKRIKTAYQDLSAPYNRPPIVVEFKKPKDKEKWLKDYLNFILIKPRGPTQDPEWTKLKLRPRVLFLPYKKYFNLSLKYKYDRFIVRDDIPARMNDLILRVKQKIKERGPAQKSIVWYNGTVLFRRHYRGHIRRVNYYDNLDNLFEESDENEDDEAANEETDDDPFYLTRKKTTSFGKRWWNMRNKRTNFWRPRKKRTTKYVKQRTTTLSRKHIRRLHKIW